MADYIISKILLKIKMKVGNCLKVTVIGAGNSGLAMAAHLSKQNNQVTLWNRSYKTIEKLIETHIIKCEGLINGEVKIYCVTDDIDVALKEPDVILITTPANSHKELAELIAKHIKKTTVIVLNPGRTFGAIEFKTVYSKYNSQFSQIIAETQTIIYTCRKIAEDAVQIIAFKNNVLISTIDLDDNCNIISYLPSCVQPYLTLANSMIQTSIGNIGMILHCAPLLLNSGWTESKRNNYKYYYEGITPTVGGLIEKIDYERVMVSAALGYKVESTKEWLIRTYNVTGDSIWECIHNNKAYETIDAPRTLKHRYIFEDIPCGLVPLEAIGLKLEIDMSYTTLIIDLASKLLGVDFRETGRNLSKLKIMTDDNELGRVF